MAASLYDDLDVLDGTPLSATETNTTSSVPLVGLRVAANWNTSESESLDVYGTGIANTNAATSMKFMQSHMAAKRAQGRRDNFSARPSIAPVVDLKQRNNAEGSYRFNHQTGRLERVGSRGVLGSSPAMMTGGLLFGEPALPLGVTDEYNPLVPNDFEELVRIKRERRRAEEAAIAAAAHRHDGSDLSGMCKRPDFSDYEDDDDEFDEPTAASGGRRGRQAAPPPKGAAIAPPSSLLEGTTVDPGSTSEGPMETEESETVGATTKFGINAVAAKMMARMGYREGQGLGRESQGMATALVVEKTSRRGGKIIHERDQQRQQATQQNPLPDSTVEETINNLPLPENRSCVILLRNMCGPGEVDDDLQPETAEECAKYGKVVSCMIFELADTPDDEAVRIFVEFESEDGATKAVLDLNGRFFAGRVVKAGFYDAEKFRNLELADAPISG